MSNVLIFLRHAQTQIDLSIPAHLWKLSEIGKKQVEKVLDEEFFQDIDSIISSKEHKAIKTVDSLASKLGLSVIIEEGLEELNRSSKQEIKTKEEYEQIVKQSFMDKNYSFDQWERIESVLERFSNAIKRIEKRYANKKILIVSHGLVLSLYFAKLLGLEGEQLFSRWTNLGFCSWGVVKNYIIEKDIV